MIRSELFTRCNGASRTRFVALFTALLGVPGSAFAAGDDSVKLSIARELQPYLYGTVFLSLLSLIIAWGFVASLLKESPGPQSMQEVGKAIKEGALAYLRKQVVMMATFGALLVVGLFALYFSFGPLVAGLVSLSFVLGCAGSYIAGYTGMVMAVNGNMRVAYAATQSYKQSLHVAFRSGAVAGLVTVGIGLLGASLIVLFGGGDAVKYLVGFGFGGSLAALFMRVGGGIFTKAADVGADLVGKVEAGIPEDDPRNPAVIADNVGDNVGDCAGMAADVFESFAVTLISTIVLASAASAVLDQGMWTKLVVFALVTAGVGLLASVIGILVVKGSDDLNQDPLVPIRRGFNVSAILSLLTTAILAFVLLGGQGQGIVSNRLVSNTVYTDAEAKVFLAARDAFLKRTWNEEVIKTHQRKRAAELKKSETALTVEELLDPKGNPPKELTEIPRTVISKVMAGQPGQLQEFEVAADELLNEPSLKDKGYLAIDRNAVMQALMPRTETVPRSLEGFTRVTDFGDTQNPVTQFAMPNNQPSTTPGEPFKPYRSVAEVFGATGDDQLVFKKVRVKVSLPEQKDPQTGVVLSPATEVDRILPLGPGPRKQLEDSVKAQSESLKQRDPKSVYEVLGTYPVEIYAGPNDRLAIAIPDALAKDLKGGAWDALQTATLAYYPRSVKDMESLRGTSLPPQKQFETVVQQGLNVPWSAFVLCFAIGLVLALAIEKLTAYYVSTTSKPTQEVAGMSSGGAASMLIQGFAYAAESGATMIFTIVTALLAPLFIFNPGVYGGYELAMFGVAMVGLGLLATTAYVLAMDTFGPISDNAQGVFEMSGEGKNNPSAARAVANLDAAGNTTKALTKGFAIATAVVASIALFNSFRSEAMLGSVGLKLDMPEIFLGLLLGGAATFLFSAFAITAVGRSSFELIEEVRRQFREKPGIMKGEEKPDYGRCVAIVTASAQRELLGPGILAIALPLAVGFGFSIGRAPVTINGQEYVLTGAQALGGFLAGTIVCGALLAVLLANSGGMWDNAKKIIEDGKFGGKGSENHRASVICDTVGDPFKDTAGPALNPLIKVMNLVALLVVGVVIQPLGSAVQITVTVVCIAAVAYAMFRNKQGSVAQQLSAAHAQAAQSTEDDTIEDRSIPDRK